MPPRQACARRRIGALRQKGIVETDGKCRSYAYDPLKRVPMKAPKLAEADPSEYEL